MQKEILKTLDQIEAQNNVKILYACESGSRAWPEPGAFLRRIPITMSATSIFDLLNRI